MKSLSISFFLALVVCAAAVSCKQTRADYRDDIAESVCDQMKQCGALGGEDAEFADYDDCTVELKEKYNDLWPAEECGGGKINDQKFNQCKQRAVSQACEGNLLDALSFRLECGAGDVCVDTTEE